MQNLSLMGSASFFFAWCGKISYLCSWAAWARGFGFFADLMPELLDGGLILATNNDHRYEQTFFRSISYDFNERK
ncbi:MAG: hypothetical protein ACI4UL_05490 [Muribaculaceae bacterium]